MKCEICGREFNTSRGLGGHIRHIHNISRREYYDKYLKQPSDGICVVCGKPTSWDKISYKTTCSIQCAARNPQRQEKIRKTNLARYGVENTYSIPQIHQRSVDKIKAQERVYKCLFCGKPCGIKKYCSEECRIKYNQAGGSYNNRQNAKRTCQKRFNGKMNGGVWNTRSAKIQQFEHEHDCTSVKKLYTQYGQAWKILNLPRIMINKQNAAISNAYLPQIQAFALKYGLTARSKAEDVLRQDIASVYLGTIVLNSRRIISPLELDIFLPDLKIAVEYNGKYWHSSNIKTKTDYHLHKSLMCREKGIRLVHIYEFEPYQEQLHLLTDLILGADNYPKEDFNKNNFLPIIPNPAIIYNDGKNIIYGAGQLY